MTSLAEQDFDALEIVVRDDGSSDATPAILDDVARRYPGRVRILKGGTNLGITENHNALMRHCHGRYIAFFGGDDVALPGKISSQVEWLDADRGRLLCHHDVDVFDSATGQHLYFYSQRHALREGSFADLIRAPAFCAAIAVMVRRDAVPTHLHDSRLRNSSDWLLWMETLLHFGSAHRGAGIVPGVLARYRRHTNNITNQADLYGLEEALLALDILLRRAPDQSRPLGVARAERMITYGLRRALRGRPLEGARLALAGAALSPRAVGRAITNAIAYFGIHRA
ncbi:MAG: glycosyltransferase [Gemmatimonadota bacterium]|nr:glycosyltransferase [Gemmatimonadota bacterium]